MSYQPPFTVTPQILNLIASISEHVGRFSVLNEQSLRLRRVNQIRTIQGSLAIEGNSLSLAQITAVLEGKPVVAPPREVQEVKNALAAYEQLTRWQATSEQDLLRAHDCLMMGLIDEVGHYRRGGVGVMSGKNVVHLAQPAKQVPRLMTDLFAWLSSTEYHPLIKSAVFHYEFEFIHPFSDGNGRMGRLWQSLILANWNPLFANLPVESVIYAHQQDYYQAIAKSTAETDSSSFIEFSLRTILDSLHEATTQEITQKTTQETPDKILLLLQSNPLLTQKQLAEQLDMTADGVKYHLNKLKQQGQLVRIGANKGGAWEVVDVAKRS